LEAKRQPKKKERGIKKYNKTTTRIGVQKGTGQTIDNGFQQGTWFGFLFFSFGSTGYTRLRRHTGLVWWWKWKKTRLGKNKHTLATNVKVDGPHEG
jgi:hypothetical protein